MSAEKRKHGINCRIGLVILAAGYGTRLSRDLSGAPQLSYLVSTPKPLLPIAGRVLIDHWLASICAISTLSEVIVVSNDCYLAMYQRWAAAKDVDINLKIVSDGSTSNDNRKGAVAAMDLGVSNLNKSETDVALIVAGDTLIPDLDICAQISLFEQSGHDLAVFSYQLDDPSDCVRRGMFREDSSGIAIELVEKPQSVTDSPSILASAPLYVLRSSQWATFSDFLAAKEHEGAPIEERDAPGFWLRWVIPQKKCQLLKVGTRIDIGSLDQYKEALYRCSGVHGSEGQSSLVILPRLLDEPAVGRAFPRVGLIGNPSDGYNGKTIAIAISSEGFAEVVATSSDNFQITPNPKHELPYSFSSLLDFESCIEDYGIGYGARQLVLAGAALFASLFRARRDKVSSLPSSKGDRSVHLENCQLTYSTSIPARLGLSGSSALILATVRALARFHNLPLPDLEPDMRKWPSLLRNVEVNKLGITCGLMDRVAQVYQGCTFMEFSPDESLNKYIRVETSRLPQFWIGYAAENSVGEHSGKLHSNLRERYQAGDSDVHAAMKELAELAEKGFAVLGGKGDIQILPKLMRRNFELREAMLGRQVVGEANFRMVNIAHRAGFAAKMCGSGGAVLCVADPVRKLSENEIVSARKMFAGEGLVLHELKVLAECVWANLLPHRC